MHYTDDVRKVLGVRAQAITRIRTNCPSFNLMLKKEEKKKNALPSIYQAEGRGERAQIAYCLPLHGPTGSESTGKEWNLAGRRTRVRRGSHIVPCVSESNPRLELQPPRASFSSF